MNIQVEPPEKKKRRKKTKNSSPPPSPPSSSPSFSLLPDEITVDYLARISRSYYPTLSTVSRSFRLLISSNELYAARSHLGSTEQCLYVCLWDPSYQFPQWFTLWINPNRTVPDDEKKKNKKIGQLLVPIASSNSPSVSLGSSVAVGSEIYVIGGPVDDEPSSAVRILDCCSHTWRDGPSMNVARENAHTCVCDGKIYVFGGCGGLEKDESWAEVFDTKNQTWECLPDPDTEIRKSKRTIYSIAEFKGKIVFGRHTNMYAYDPKHCKWERYENWVPMLMRSKCVLENVSHSCYIRFLWLKDGHIKHVKGLDSLEKKYMRNGGSNDKTTKVVGCGGNIFVIWEGHKRNPNGRKEIWGAEIELEERDGGEPWGKVKWVDVVHIVPISCQLLHCVAVSL